MCNFQLQRDVDVLYYIVMTKFMGVKVVFEIENTEGEGVGESGGIVRTLKRCKK